MGRGKWGILKGRPLQADSIEGGGMAAARTSISRGDGDSKPDIAMCQSAALAIKINCYFLFQPIFITIRHSVN